MTAYASVASQSLSLSKLSILGLQRDSAGSLFSTAVKPGTHWINAVFLSGLDARFLHDDWRIHKRLSPFLIDSDFFNHTDTAEHLQFCPFEDFARGVLFLYNVRLGEIKYFRL